LRAWDVGQLARCGNPQVPRFPCAFHPSLRRPYAHRSAPWKAADSKTCSSTACPLNLSESHISSLHLIAQKRHQSASALGGSSMVWKGSLLRFGVTKTVGVLSLMQASITCTDSLNNVVTQETISETMGTVAVASTIRPARSVCTYSSLSLRSWPLAHLAATR
jgi:hypothetical protein